MILKKDFNDEQWLAYALVTAGLKGAFVVGMDENAPPFTEIPVTLVPMLIPENVSEFLSQTMQFDPKTTMSVLSYILCAGLDTLCKEWGLDELKERERLVRVIGNKAKTLKMELERKGSVIH